MRLRGLLGVQLVGLLLAGACSGGGGGQGQDISVQDVSKEGVLEDSVSSGCVTADDCQFLQHTVCQEPVCNLDSNACELEAIPDCVLCDGPSTCPQGGLCEVAECDKGRCGIVTLEDGIACDDGNLCTQNDQCNGGFCVPGEEMVCVAADPCHDVGICNPDSGLCSNPPKTDGTECDDDNLCTPISACQLGVCVGANPVVCTSADDCHLPGTCDPETGNCSVVTKDDGALCNDGDLCTPTDQCLAGVCTGGDAVECSALDGCHLAGECNPETGLCSNPNQEDGTPCDDGNLCTQTDQCQLGTCMGSNPVECTALDQCHVVGACDPLSGVCSDPNRDNGWGCDDGNLCTLTDECQEGICTGSNPVECVALDQCHMVGQCAPDTGLCTDPIQENGTGCDDGDLCTQTDECQEGACTGANPVECSALDQCHVPGTCDPDTGVCWDPIVEEGSGCDDGDPCTVGDVCSGGSCVPGGPMDCKDDDQCTHDYCQEGACHNDPLDGCIPEDCADGVDNNGNSWIDCDDPLCSEDEACQDVALGENCAVPYLVNDGAPIGSDDIGLVWTFSGDTTGKGHHYPNLCYQDFSMPDEVFRVDVTEPVRLRVTHDFDDNNPATAPYAVMMVFDEVCFPDNLIACGSGGSDGAVYDNIVQPGTYFFVVTGYDYYWPDWGPYTFTVEVYTTETTETDCQDGIDNEGDGLTDCADPECYDSEGCEQVTVLDDLTCGETWTGTFLDLEESHFFTFTLEQDGNVAVYWEFPDNADDYGYVNFYAPETDPPRHDTLWGTGKMVWHTGQSAGFEGDAGVLYVVMFELSTLDSGEYTLTLACADEPESNCEDGIDNDADSWVDCEDPDCYDQTICNGGYSGDTCAEAIPVNDGLTITAIDIGDEGLSYNFLGTTATKNNDLSASCASGSALGPDMVYQFVLDDNSEFSAFVEFTEGIFDVPSIYLYSGQCISATLLGCGSGFMGWIGIDQVLPPGTYYLVVDSGGTNFSGVPYQGPFSLDLYFDPPPIPENCVNGVDDDADGRADCEDPECFDDSICTGGHSGENCADPFFINGAVPLPVDYSERVFNTTIGKSNDVGNTCAPVSVDGPDAVHSFFLSQEATLTISVQFNDGFTPALILYDGACNFFNMVECVTAEWDTVTLSELTLPAGQYYLLIDSGGSLFGTPMANHYSLWISTVQEDCTNSLDDDGDGRVDCEDPHCFADELCNGAFSGEDCSTAYPLNGVVALEADEDYEAWQTTEEKSNDLAASCSTAASEGPDSVHSFLLESAMFVSASVYFDNQSFPAISMFGGTCQPEDSLACDLGTWSVAALDEALLEPGTYFIVIDSGETDSQGPNASSYILTVTTRTP